MITKLGLISGEIITTLEEVRGPLTLKEIEVYLGEKKDVILMSLGSLIRQGLIETEYTNETMFYRYTKRLDIG